MHARRVVGVGADVRLAGDVADRVVGDGLGHGERQAGIAGDRLGQAVETVIGEIVGGLSDRIDPLGQVAERVEGEAEVLDGIAGAGPDGRDAAGVRVVFLIGDDGVAEGLLDQVQLGAVAVGGPDASSSLL
jgi:hypothetical protein